MSDTQWKARRVLRALGGHIYQFIAYLRRLFLPKSSKTCKEEDALRAAAGAAEKVEYVKDETHMDAPAAFDINVEVNEANMDELEEYDAVSCGFIYVFEEDPGQDNSNADLNMFDDVIIIIESDSDNESEASFMLTDEEAEDIEEQDELLCRNL